MLELVTIKYSQYSPQLAWTKLSSLDSTPKYRTLCSEPPSSQGVLAEASTEFFDDGIPHSNGTQNGTVELPKYFYGGKMQISEATAPGLPATGSEPCRFPKLEECAHFHYERVHLPQILVTLQTSMDQSLHSQHANDDDTEYFMVQVTSGDECWLLQRNFENFKMLDDQLHQCIFDRKISQLPDISNFSPNEENLESKLICYLERLSQITDNSVNCGPVLNWLQMDNRGHRLLVPSEESRSINTPAVAAAYSVRRYVSQARDELNLEVGDMISVIDMASPGESMWWRGKRGFQVGFFPQHCVHIIGDKVPRNMPLPPPVVGSLALTPIKPVLRKHGKLITFFRSFILNRPSRRRLKQSGILKERVFGCDLGEHLLNSGKDVPTVLKCCAEFIETKGIVDGIYRLSGVTSNIQKLRNAFDEDRVPDLYTEDILKDIHSVASLLKMYFRELPNPLCTYQLYQSFVNAVQGCSPASRDPDNDHERLLKMREAVQKLPPPHYRTLEYLMRHLAKVATHAESTGMTTRNVAIVWAPNLLRCESLEIGGVAALQGVGVQAVVTEFLICYSDLIFCDHLPSIDRPDLAEKENLLAKKCRPNSLNIATPTKLITLEEARSKHNLLNKTGDECTYIEVGGGPNNLPKIYHTVIELPSGARKRAHTKRSPLGWRMFFTKSRNPTSSQVLKTRNISGPILINEKAVTESDLTDMKRILRSVKSAESLTSGHSEPASTEDVLGPLYSLHKPPGHNRSVSHDSYFDTLQSSQNNSEGSLLDLSEIHLNFDLEESEMRIFSEDESLVSSPRIQKDNSQQRKSLTHSRQEDNQQNLTIPSPKKQARVVLSPESASRKRTRLEDQLSDIQYIDCNTPENIVSTTALVHQIPTSPITETEQRETYQPKNKSPRNSDNLETKRQSLNLESSTKKSNPITKSFTEVDINRHSNSVLSTPSVSSPGYNALRDSSENTTPGFSPNFDLTPSDLSKSQNNYENILTTINITYRSPPTSLPSTPVYENVTLNPEKVEIPQNNASLPQEGKLPEFLTAGSVNCERPKSLSALEDCQSTESTLKANSSGAVCNTSEQISLNSFNDQKTLSSNQSSNSNIQFTQSSHSPTVPYSFIKNCERLSPTDLSLSEVIHSSTENLSTSHTSISFPHSFSKNSLSPNVSPTSDGQKLSLSNDNFFRPSSVNLIDFSPSDAPGSPSRSFSQNDKRKSDETESFDENAIYQQVKYFRRSIHEVNALLDLEQEKSDSLVHVIETNPDIVEAAIESNIKSSPNDYEDVLNVKSDSVFEEILDPHIYEDVEIKGDPISPVEDKEVVECEQNEYDSLEDNFVVVSKEEHVYEDLETPKKDTHKTDIEEKCVENERFNVKDLKSMFEAKTSPKSSRNDVQYERSISDDPTTKAVRKTYEKDSLPPCLRARNLKQQMKTRSLDEDEFEKEFLAEKNQRNKSTSQENVHNTYKTNSLPKILNQPKKLPPLVNDQIDSIHLAHSSQEKLNLGTTPATVHSGQSGTEDEDQKKRERIEKYKEERRRILHEKFRSESFKEDKDILLSRLKIYKSKDENLDQTTAKVDKNLTDERPLRARRKTTKSESEKLSGNDVKMTDSHTVKANLSKSTQNVEKTSEISDRLHSEQTVIDNVSRISDRLQNDQTVIEKGCRIGDRLQSDQTVIDKGSRVSDGLQSDQTVIDKGSRIGNRLQSDLTVIDKGSRLSERLQGEQTVIDQGSRISDKLQSDQTVIDKEFPISDRLGNNSACQSKTEIDPQQKPMTNSLRSRAAIFEQNSQKPPLAVEFSGRRPSVKEQNKFGKNPPDRDSDVKKLIENPQKDKDNTPSVDRSDRDRNTDFSDDSKELDFIRQKTANVAKEERRRHTYETRERETEADRVRRVSLENNRSSSRKEKMSPTYCIKDMKALFESKSKP